MPALLRIVSKTRGLAQQLALRNLDTVTKASLMFEAVGRMTVAQLVALTNERRAPVKRGEPWRRAHIGHWADVSGQLAGAYRFEVHVDRARMIVSLIMINGSEHAAYLEAREGYFVLTGVTDPGGVIEQAMAVAIPLIAPRARLVRR